MPTPHIHQTLHEICESFDFFKQMMWFKIVTRNQIYILPMSYYSNTFYLLSSSPELFSWKGVLKICSKFTEHPCRSVISKKLLCNFIEITLQHGCSSVNLLHIFRKPFYKNNSGGLLLPSNVFSFDVKDVKSLI